MSYWDISYFVFKERALYNEQGSQMGIIGRRIASIKTRQKNNLVCQL